MILLLRRPSQYIFIFTYYEYWVWFLNCQKLISSYKKIHLQQVVEKTTRQNILDFNLP